MTTMARRGLLVALVHVSIVASLGAKLMLDRATRPRVWARAAPVDPNLPIRGRYVSVQIEALVGPGLVFPQPEATTFPDGTRWTPPPQPVAVDLVVRDSELMALPSPDSSRVYARASRIHANAAEIEPALAYFIPEHVPDPSRRAPGEELWVEVTIPRAGGPRPIRLGIKKDGVLTPLE
jgi:hypothetical protein